MAIYQQISWNYRFGFKITQIDYSIAAEKYRPKCFTHAMRNLKDSAHWATAIAARRCDAQAVFARKEKFD
jgi:hypothetical protein